MDSILGLLFDTLRPSGLFTSSVTTGKQTLPALKCCPETSHWTRKALELLEVEEHLVLDPALGRTFPGIERALRIG